ncbi:MAG: 3-deoxy-D-manno-octulosonic acid transferase, partial [Verrucomicrobiota bacterium]
PLASRLVAVGGATRVADAEALSAILREWLESPERAGQGTAEAARILDRHRGATGRILDFLNA